MSKTIKLLLSGTGLLLAILLIAPLAMADFMPADVVQNLSQTQTDAGFPAIAVSPDGKKIGVVWAERYQGGDSLQGPIYFRAGDRDSAQFSERTTVDFSVTENDQSTTPDIASDPSGTMHIVWRNLKDDGSRIYYATCSITLPVTAEQADCDADADHFEIDAADNPANGDTVNTPAVAANLGSVTGTHVVWTVKDGGANSESIYYRGRDKNGAWSLSSTFIGSGIQPAIATSVSGGINYVHLVWVDNSPVVKVVKYRRGVDNTVPADGIVDSWGSVVPLPIPSGTSHPGYPQVVALTDTVVVMWDVFAGLNYDPQPADDLYRAVYAVSYDNGDNFSAAALNVTSGNTSYTDRRSDNNPSDTNNALRGTGHAERLQLSVAIDPGEGISGTVHLAWHQTAVDGAAYYHDIFYSAYGPFGEDVYDWKYDPALNETDANGTAPNGTLGKVDEVNYPRAYSTAPDIAAAPGAEESPTGEVHMVYMEGDQNGGALSGFKIIDPNPLNNFTFNVYYTNNIGELGDDCATGLLCMATPDVVNNGVFLPVLLKNSK